METNENQIKPGDFTTMAKDYVNRPGYSHLVLRLLAQHTGALERPNFVVADVGAGTGKLTEDLCALGLTVLAVEPNDIMREEGIRSTRGLKMTWSKGSGEETGLGNGTVDWVLMGSAFHWVEKPRCLHEFYRILKPGGYFTAVYNPRDIEACPFQQAIERKINEIAQEPHEEYSAAQREADDRSLAQSLLSTGAFGDLIFIEAPYQIHMTPERYLGYWRSVNAILARVGPEKWQRILEMIEREMAGLDELVIP